MSTDELRLAPPGASDAACAVCLRMTSLRLVIGDGHVPICSTFCFQAWPRVRALLASLDEWQLRYETAIANWRAEVRELEAKQAAELSAASSANASLTLQVESMAVRIERLAEELAKPEDVRLCEVLDALDGRAVIFDGVGARVGYLLGEMDGWIGRAGEAERALSRIREILGTNGCDCDCGHHYEEHDADCTRCLACRIKVSVFPARGGSDTSARTRARFDRSNSSRTGSR